MSESAPLEPTGNNCEASFAQKVSRKTFGQSGRIRNTSTVRVDERHDGIFLHVKKVRPSTAPKDSSSPIQAFLISTTVNGDYWVCTAVVGGATVNVAKPYKLRNSITSATIDGNAWTYAYTNTVERTATSGSYSEYQRISPRVLANDLIFAANIGATATGVTSVLWQDLNVNGCAWSPNVDQSAP